MPSEEQIKFTPEEINEFMEFSTTETKKTKGSSEGQPKPNNQEGSQTPTKQAREGYFWYRQKSGKIVELANGWREYVNPADNLGTVINLKKPVTTQSSPTQPKSIPIKQSNKSQDSNSHTRRSFLLAAGATLVSIVGVPTAIDIGLYSQRDQTIFESIINYRSARYLPPPEAAAKRIMGDDYFGPEDAHKAFGLDIGPNQISQVLFSEKELKKAKENRMMLIYRIDRADNSLPLSVRKMYEKLRPFLSSQDSMNMENNVLNFTENLKVNKDIFDKELPSIGWVLTSKRMVPNSSYQNYLEQTKSLSDYIAKMITNESDYLAQAQALVEFGIEHQGLDINQPNIANRLNDLSLNTKFRPTTADVLYDFAIYFLRTGKKLMANSSIWTRDLVDGTQFVTVNSDFSLGSVSFNERKDVGELYSFQYPFKYK